MTKLQKPSLSRRSVLQAAAVGAVGISPAMRAVAYAQGRSEEHTSELQSRQSISYAVFCL